MNRRQSWNMILLFCILIFGFTGATILVPKRTYSENENRSLAQMPKLSAEALLDGSFESDYEKYLTDQFVLRDGWIGMKTGAERLMLRSESKDIYFGDDGYLIEKHSGSFTSELAEQNISVLQSFAAQYQKQFGENFTVMIVPNAVSVLRDKLPAYASPYDQNLYLQKLREALPEGAWFDAAEVLEAHKEEEIFYRTDHHWKTLAAFYVYQEWARAQGLTVPSAEDYEIRTVTEEFEGTIQSKLGIETRKDSIQLYLPPGDPFYTVQTAEGQEPDYSVYDYPMLDTKDKYAVYFGGNHALTQIRTKVKNGRKILIIKDSYANCFVPFLLSEFEAVDMLDIRMYNQKVSDLIASGEYTDLMFLYNASGFAEETSVARLAY